MFEYLEPDADGASNLPPAQPGRTNPHPERLRHMLYGSRAGIARTIKILHALGYTDPNDWSDPIPAPLGATLDGPPQPLGEIDPTTVETWIAIATKTVLIE